MSAQARPESVELETLERDLWWTEKANFVSAGLWRGTRLLLGLASTAASVTAAASIISDGEPVVAGIASMVAALATGLLTFLKPDDVAQQHLVAGRAMTDLRARVRQTRTLDLPASTNLASIRAEIRVLTTDRAQIYETAPHLSNVSTLLVDRRKKKGRYGRSVVE